VLIGDPRAVETQRLLEQAEKRDEWSRRTRTGPRETGRAGHRPMMHTPLTRQPIHNDMYLAGRGRQEVGHVGSE